jgi:hypothetical protein
MIRRSKPLKRSPIRRHPPKRKEGFGNPQYRDWLKSLPCVVCFKKYADDLGYDWLAEYARAEVRRLFLAYQCTGHSLRQVAHVGMRGLSQRCPDREAIPLCAEHHLHPTAGGGVKSHHALGKPFWSVHGLERATILAMLPKLYQQETGLTV